MKITIYGCSTNSVSIRSCRACGWVRPVGVRGGFSYGCEGGVPASVSLLAVLVRIAPATTAKR